MSPAAQLADLLITRRRAGEPFRRSWAAAVAELDWPTGEKAEREWRQALAFAKTEFQDAYEHPGSTPDELTRLLRANDEQIAVFARQKPALVLTDL